MSRLGVAALFAILGLAYGATVADPVVTCAWDDCDVQCGGGNRVCQRSDGKTWNIDCHKQDCAPVTGCGYADIVFVLDASTSIGEKNWWKAKQFVIDVCKGLTVGPDESRVAVVIYSNKGHTMWDLSAYSTMAELEAKIWEIEYIKGNTNTYEGLLFADWVFGNTSRKEYKNIAIVLSDGEANNKKDMLPDQCQKLHDDGVEVFAVGISKEANMDEIRMIASEPKETHARNVSDYSALTTIVNEIIDETCEAATKWRCDPWTDWTKCLVVDILNPKKCGVNAGVQSRARTCYYYTVGGTVEETHVFTETKLCDVACSGPLCARCTYNVDGIGYLPHDNCHQFVKCQYIGEGDYLQHEMVCPENQYWRQSILSCDVIPEQGYVCDDTPVVRTTTTTTPAPCQFSAHPTEKNKYIWHLSTGDVEMPCGYGTVFSDFACGCVHGGGNDQSCSSDTLLHFPFNVNTDDICNRAKGTIEGNVTIADNAAYFNGNSKVLVGFLKNWFAENPTNELTLSLWFKYLGDDDNFRGLFGNGDCKDDDSLMLAIGGWIAQGQVRTDFGAANFDGHQLNMGITKDDWTLLTLVKTSWNVKYYINGVEFSSISLSGDVANTQIPATIGSTCGKWNDQLQKDEEFFFNGFIDDVRIYTKVLWDSDIQTLNTDGRQ